jgi:hypothetical protein
VLNDHKLPIHLQLVGLTAVVVFCFSAATFFVDGYAAWQGWEQVISDPRHIYLLTAARVAILAVVSAVTFVTLMRRSSRDWAAIAIAYLTLLVLLHCWSVVSWWSVRGGWSNIHANDTYVAELVLKILAMAWLATLLLKTWSAIRSMRP